MTSDNEREEQLREAIDVLLRRQPARRAPMDLERRVLDEVARRAAQPWWRRDYAGWPITARLMFLLASVGFAWMALGVASWLVTQAKTVSTAIELAPKAALLRSLASLAMSIVHGIPPLWLYGGLGVIVGTYALLFGLGAVGYRTLYAQR